MYKWNPFTNNLDEKGDWFFGGNTLSSKKTLGSRDNQDFGIITNNLERLTVLKGGNVGIGMASPTAKLHIQADTTGTQTPLDIYGYRTVATAKPARLASISQIGTYGQGVLNIYNSAFDSAIHLASDGNSYINPQNGGNVGIGTIVPQKPLEVLKGVVGQNSLLKLTNSFGSPNNTADIDFRIGGTDSTINSRIATIRTDRATPLDSDLVFSLTSNSALVERFRIKDNGNVGIGTTAPSAKLHVFGTGQEMILGDTTYNNHWLSFRDSVYGSDFGFSIASLIGSNSTNGQFLLRTGSQKGFAIAVGNNQTFTTVTNPQFVIDSAGLVGIGTTAPSAKLQVVGTTRLGDSTTNYTAFESDGTMVMNGTATVFDDLLGDITQVKTLGPGVSLDTAESTIDFTTASNLSDYVLVNYQLSHKWKPGSDIYPHIHWKQNSNATPNFLIQYRWQRNGQAWTTAWTNLKCNTSIFTYTSGSLNQIADSATITPPTGYSLSDIIQFRIIRDNANTSTLFTGADAYTGDAEITGVDIHFEQDTLGSRTEYTK